MARSPHGETVMEREEHPSDFTHDELENQQTVKAELEEELNPVQKRKGPDDLSQRSQPIEIINISSEPVPGINLNVHKEPEPVIFTGFKTDSRIIDYLRHVRPPEHSQRARDIQHVLLYATRRLASANYLSEVVKQIDHLHEQKCLTDEQYEELQAFLPAKEKKQEEPQEEKEEKSEEVSSVMMKKDEELSSRPETTETSPYLVPPDDLINYVEELVRRDVKVRYLLSDLKDARAGKIHRTFAEWKQRFKTPHDMLLLSDAEYDQSQKFLEEVAPSPEPEVVVERIPEKIEKEERNEAKEEKQEEKSEEIAHPALEDAREAYAEKLVEWKNEHREKKNIFHKLLSDLGVERPLPETEEPLELREARDAYVAAKKSAHAPLFSKTEKRTRSIKGQILDLKDIEYEINPELIAAAEKEMTLLEKKVAEASPEGKKKMTEIVLEKWSKLPRAAQIAISTTLFTGTSFVFGGAAAAGVVTYAGFRAGRSLAGGLGGQFVGKKVDGIFKRKNEKANEALGEEYGTEINAENFEDRERDFMKAVENQKTTEARQRLMKVGAMIAGGAGVTASLSPLEAIYTHGDVASHALDHLSKPKISGHDIASSHETPAASVEPVEIKLSSKGFIADIHHLKEQITARYAGKPIPHSLEENILKKSDIQLAKEFHFYDPAHNESAIGLKGETLGIDSKGNLIYQHLDGSKDMVINTTTGETHPFAGKMFTPEASHPAPAHISEIAAVTPDHVVDHVEHSGPLMFNNMEIANEHAGVLRLHDTFQDGKKYAPVRAAFTENFEKSPAFGKLGTTPLAIPFEEGKIYLVHGGPANPDEIKVLLNGRYIAMGSHGPDSVKLLDDPGLKGGWLLSTVYERAFKQAKVALKNIQQLPLAA